MQPLASVGVVVIGRNEASRLAGCLASIPANVPRIYVDSASSDGSAALARSRSVETFELPPEPPVSAARARAAGLERLVRQAPGTTLVQFLDGDCELDPQWLAAAAQQMETDPGLGAVWGAIREREPGISLFNRVCDLEWRVPPPGEARHFAGVALVRVEACRAAGGYDPGVVASEDHELSARVRARGWRIRRLPIPMVVHDAGMTTPGQWWRRSVRRGVGSAQVWARHRERPELIAMIRTILWGAVVPAAALLLAWPTRGLSLLALLLYPLRVARIALRSRRAGGAGGDAVLWGVHCVAGAFPQLCGLLLHALRALARRPARIIEWRRPRSTPPEQRSPTRP
jgi:GT2 family glycosyltransferase